MRILKMKLNNVKNYCNMEKKLAIKGHPTRGKEVIELLEMMGGVNVDSHKGHFPDEWKSSYYIYGDNTIQFARDEFLLKLNFVIFTLEEFLEKYPFKVGDLKDRKVDSISCIIDKMRWNSEKECIEYHGSFGTNDYGWHRAEDFRIYDSFPNIFSQKFKTAEISFNEKVCKPEVELKLGNYEIEVRNGKTYAILKKSKYPTTYEDCCDKINFKGGFKEILLSDNEYSLCISFIKLKRCRDAYWKIYGEELGLGKPWEPSWQKTEEGKFCIIRRSDNVVTKWETKTIVRFLAFPTKEMRDAFYENFKDLIEQCKELL